MWYSCLDFLDVRNIGRSADLSLIGGVTDKIKAHQRLGRHLSAEMPIFQHYNLGLMISILELLVL